MTLPELIKDIEQQFSECPCGDCLAKINYECEPPFGRSNNGELLFPEVRPVYFYCDIKGETLNTDEMKGKQCGQKKSTERRKVMTDKVQKIHKEVERLQTENKEKVIYILSLAIWIGGFVTINYFYPNSVILWTWACIWFVIIMIYILFFTNSKGRK